MKFNRNKHKFLYFGLEKQLPSKEWGRSGLKAVFIDKA